MKFSVLIALLVPAVAFSDPMYSVQGHGPAVFVIYAIDDPSMTPIKERLVNSGYSVVSVDFPCSGNPGGELECWRARYEHGITFDSYVSDVLALMKRFKATAVVGVSKTGFLASLIAARDNDKIDYILISPVVNLFDLKEFAGAKKSGFADIRDTYRSLEGKRIFLTIGKRDGRVNTASSIDLARKVPSITLLLTNTEGHVHSDIDQVAVDWLNRKTY